MSELPDIEVGDAYALRTFKAEDGLLVSVNQGGGHWVDGVCIATCRVDPEHVAPVAGCHCGVYAWWDLDKLEAQYGKFTRHMVAIILMGGEVIEGDKGVKAGEAQIVAWWCAEDATELIAACEASAPDTRRYFDRDVMIGFYPPPPPEERNREEVNSDG